MPYPPCALALTGGVAKGAFHAGVLKALAEHEIIPVSLVGASAGALNGAVSARLIAEDRFTPYWVEREISQMWLQQVTLQKLWASADIQDHSLRAVFGDTRPNLFMLRRAFDWLSPHRLRELLHLRFTSIFSDKHFRQQLERGLRPLSRVEREVHFAAAITSLHGQTETYGNQSLISHGGYASFHLHPGQEADELERTFELMRTVVLASSSFPGVFPPVSLRYNGVVDDFTDGGLTKNAPFGRAIKLSPEVRTIFLVSCAPITQPTTGRVDSIMSIVDQIYKIMLNKDIANDYRKIQQINERIETLQRLLQRNEQGAYLDNDFNRALLEVAGYKSLEQFSSQRTVEIVIIEPTHDLEGDPFAGMYRPDRVALLERYMAQGYAAAQATLKPWIARQKAL